jgi:hypothetical protein
MLLASLAGQQGDGRSGFCITRAAVIRVRKRPLRDDTAMSVEVSTCNHAVRAHHHVVNFCLVTLEARQTGSCGKVQPYMYVSIYGNVVKRLDGSLKGRPDM